MTDKNDNTFSGTLIEGTSDAAVVFIHGFSDTPESLMPLAEYIHHALNVSCYLPLLEGHGATLDDFERANHQTWIAQVEKVYTIAAARFAHVFIVGFSMGGLLATIACAARCEGRVLIAPAFDVGIKRQIKLLFVPLLKRFKRYSYKNPEHTTFNRNLYDPEMKEKYRLFYDREPLRAIEEYGHIRRKALLRIRDVSEDAMVILSESDRVVDFSRTKAIIATHQPKWRIIELERSGHMIPLDYEREIVYTVTKEFIRRKIAAE